MTVWKSGIELVARVYQLTKSFPREEQFGLKSQIRRAAVSIPSNIAEGSSRRSEKEFRHYLEISTGSCFEVETDIIIAAQLKFISEEDSVLLLNELHLQQRRLNSLIVTLNKSI